MKPEEFKILFERKKRWYDKFFNLAMKVKNQPESKLVFDNGKTPTLHINYRVIKIRRIWHRLYEDLWMFQLEKDDNGYYLHQLAFTDDTGTK